MDNWGYLILVLAFLGLFGILESAYLLWGNRRMEAKRIKRRLHVIAEEAPVRLDPILKRGAYSTNEELDRFLKRFAFLEALDVLLRQSGKRFSVAQMLGTTLGCALLALLFTLVLQPSLPVGLLTVVGATLLPLLVLKVLKTLRLSKIEAQLPHTLDLLSQSLRAGHSFTSALRGVGTEGPEPIASEFRMAADEISFGSTVRNGVVGLANRVNNMDMRFFALAVMIQHETGGNLSKLLSDLAALIRERQKLRRTIRVLSAEGRTSAWVLGLLPFIFAVLINFINPGYMRYFIVDPTGQMLVKLMFGLLMVAIIWIRSVINIKA